MRIDPLVLIRGVSEFVTVVYGPAVTFGFPDLRVRTYRRPVLHLNIISVIDGSSFNWYAQNVLREAMSVDLLFKKIAGPKLIAINFNNHFRDRMGEADGGHVEVYPKLWNLRPSDKTNGEIFRILRLLSACQKLRTETED